MRAKKKNVGYAIVGRSKGREKFTMEHLKVMLEKKDSEMRDPLIMSFEQLYGKYKTALEIEMEPRSSMQDPMSPRESDSMSMVSLTPKGMDAISRRSFFKEQPGSTTHAAGHRMDLGTPKGEFKMFDNTILP